MTLGIMVITGAIVFFGKWSQKKNNSIGQEIGLAIATIFLLFIEKESPRLALGFAWLIFFSAFYVYGGPLVAAVTKTQKVK